MRSPLRALLVPPLLVVTMGAASTETPSEAPPAVEPPAVAPALHTVRKSERAFGVEVQALALVANDEEARRAATHLDDAFRELARIAAVVDPAQGESEVARINRAAGGEPVVVSPEVFGLLAEAQRVARISAGAFDPTAAPLEELWRFTVAEGEAFAAPPDELLKERRLLVGHKLLVLDATRRTALLKRAGQAIALDGIAKGYALERAAELLEERGLSSFMLAAGGDVVVRGRRGDRPWRVGLQDPRAAGHFAATTVEGGAVMTTGDYERFVLDGEQRFHDVLDPRTGKPAAHARSVTVFADDAAAAEALSSALFVLGPKKGMALARRLKGVEVVMVTGDNHVLVSKGLEKRLSYRAPTDAP